MAAGSKSVSGVDEERQETSLAVAKLAHYDNLNASFWRSFEPLGLEGQQMKPILAGIVIFFALVANHPAAATPLCLFEWNLESGGSDQATIEEIIKKHPKCDVFGFAEVASRETLDGIAKAAEAASGRRYSFVISNTSPTGPDNTPDFLGLMWNAGKLDLIHIEELYALKLGGGRAPFIGHFVIKSNKKAFTVMVNHLHRGSAEKRLEQAKAIHDWAQGATVPMITLGDFNMDCVVSDDRSSITECGPAFHALTDDGTWKWVKPSPIHETHCSRYRGKLMTYDFVLTAGPAQSGEATAEVLEQTGYCPNTPSKPDHMPLHATVEIP